MAAQSKTLQKLGAEDLEKLLSYLDLMAEDII